MRKPLHWHGFHSHSCTDISMWICPHCHLLPYLLPSGWAQINLQVFVSGRDWLVVPLCVQFRQQCSHDLRGSTHLLLRWTTLVGLSVKASGSPVCLPLTLGQRCSPSCYAKSKGRPPAACLRKKNISSYSLGLRSSFVCILRGILNFLWPVGYPPGCILFSVALWLEKLNYIQSTAI